MTEIFLSYCWKDEAVANSIDVQFHDIGVSIKRDTRDVRFTQSIKQYMKSIRESDFCLVVISDSFLKSMNCMYEMLEFIKDENFKDRILPIISSELNIFTADRRSVYVKYWEDEFQRVKTIKASLSELNQKDIIDDLRMIENIHRTVSDFLRAVTDLRLVEYRETLSPKKFEEIRRRIFGEADMASPVEQVDGYFLLNVPRTIIEKTFIWWRSNSQGYSDDMSEARVFSAEEIVQKFSDPLSSEWNKKKYLAIPTQEARSVLGQNFVPYNSRFIAAVESQSSLCFGNTRIHLTKDEIEWYG